MLYLSPILMRSAPPSPCYLQCLGRVPQMCAPTSPWDLVRSPSQSETSFLRYHSCTGKLPLWPKRRPFWPSSTSPGCWRPCVCQGQATKRKGLVMRMAAGTLWNLIRLLGSVLHWEHGFACLLCGSKTFLLPLKKPWVTLVQLLAEGQQNQDKEVIQEKINVISSKGGREDREEKHNL